MTPDPPAPSEGSSLPPRHRPALGNLAKDTTELDLWAFEDDLELPDELPEPPAGETTRSSARDIPAPRERKKGKPREFGSRPTPPPQHSRDERVQINVNKPAEKLPPAEALAGQAKPEREFDDLENWDNAKLEPELEELPQEDAEEPPKPNAPPEPELPKKEIQATPPPQDGKTATETPLPDDEFAPAALPASAKPVPLLPNLALTKVERIGLISLVALLLVGAATVLMFSLNRLPSEPEKAGANDFPVQGKLITVNSAVSYWRVPITEGSDQDTFRRGTELLPVLELSLTGGPAGIRVLFRNDEREVVGDAVTRTVRGGGTLKIPATAGFDDLGMHAAYRTGESKPWTIEVSEAPAEDAPSNAFRKLFEMNIATDRR